jgi:hypothetical protein
MKEEHMPGIDGDSFSEKLGELGDHNPPDVPNGKITQFDKDRYNSLIRYVDYVEGVELNQNLNRPGTGVRLDGNLGSGIFPGSSKWPVAGALVEQGKAFGTSVQAQYTKLSDGWEQYVAALKNARDVFEQTNDLNTLSASKFATDFPDAAGTTSAGGATGNTGGGSSNTGGDSGNKGGGSANKGGGSSNTGGGSGSKGGGSANKGGGSN